MSHKFELSPETLKALYALRDALDDETREHRDVWDGRSERWQESDKGEAVDTWIEILSELLDTLDAVDERPTSW